MGQKGSRKGQGLVWNSFLSSSAFQSFPCAQGKTILLKQFKNCTEFFLFFERFAYSQNYEFFPPSSPRTRDDSGTNLIYSSSRSKFCSTNASTFLEKVRAKQYSNRTSSILTMKFVSILSQSKLWFYCKLTRKFEENKFPQQGKTMLEVGKSFQMARDYSQNYFGFVRIRYEIKYYLIYLNDSLMRYPFL